MKINRYLLGILTAGFVTLGICNFRDNTTTEKFKMDKPIYSSQGTDIIMQRTSSFEILSPEQVKRWLEFHLRNLYFIESDINKDGMLDSEEAKSYLSKPIFNHRFR